MISYKKLSPYNKLTCLDLNTVSHKHETVFRFKYQKCTHVYSHFLFMNTIKCVNVLNKKNRFPMNGVCTREKAHRRQLHVMSSSKGSLAVQ